MPSRIHLIEHLGLMQKVDGNIFDSGYWKIKPQQAEELIGFDIYFHKKQKEPSYFGGKILAYRVHDGSGGEHPDCHGRVVFTFESSREHRNVSAGDGGWSYEKKIV